jgi:hypothetical protein
VLVEKEKKNICSFLTVEKRVVTGTWGETTVTTGLGRL